MHAQDCIFCQIVDGKIPADIVYQDDTVLAFNDIYPKAPVHQLIIPRKHIATLNDLEDRDIASAGRLLYVARLLAKQAGIENSGYRLSVNCLDDGGQEVFHLHCHLMGGRRLGNLA